MLKISTSIALSLIAKPANLANPDRFQHYVPYFAQYGRKL